MSRKRGPIIARTGRFAGLIAVLLASVSITACGSASEGPLQTLSAGGKPVLAMTSVVVTPGQSADAEAYVTTSAKNYPVQVTSVSVVPVAGEPAGTLVHAGVQSTGASVAADRGWPAVPVEPLIGAQLAHRLPGNLFGIVFGASGPATGHNYAVAGLRIGYRYHGQSYSMIAWAPLAICVAASLRSNTPSCQPFQQKINQIVMKLSGHPS